MSLAILPNEIFSQILDLISFQDQKTCMLICYSWHDRFQSVVLKNITITTRQQFKQLLSKLDQSHQIQQVSLGLLIRRLTLGSHVGVTNAEFNQLPIYCPFLEYFDFNPVLWKYFSYTNNIKLWSYLSRFPCMQRLKLTVSILRDTGRNMTQLELSPVMVDELVGTEFTIISILAYTPNLTYLKLSSGIVVSQNISISEFESIHTLCPQLERLELCSFDAHLLSKDSYLVDIETLPITSKLKQLRLDISINSEEFLDYWAYKYPNIESLDMQLRLLEPEYYHEQVEPENSRMKESFTVMASRFTGLQNLRAQFDEKYFPCDVFLRGMNSRQMQQISIHFFNFDYLRRTARNFKILMNRSMETLKHVEISNWDRSWDYEQDILIPMGKCTFLESLSLSPQPGTLTEFDIDVILDYCTGLKSLELKNTYNLFVRDDVNKTRIHDLQEFSLKHTMVNNQLFDYLAIRCPYLNKLDILHMTKPYDNDIQVKINMPYHAFKYIRIMGLQLGLRIEDSGFQCNCSSAICSLEETQKVESKKPAKYPERWYHLYQPKQNHSCNPPPRLQRLNHDQVKKLEEMKITKHLWEQISFAGVRLKYETKKNWEFDIPFGFTSVRCRSIDEFKFEGVLL